jgi:hypothetical protein
MKRNARATVYFEEGLHAALRLKAASMRQPISVLVNNAVRQMLREDHQDIQAFEARETEPTYTFEELIAELNDDGTL